MTDGETRTSRIVGSVDFGLIEKSFTDAPDDELLVVLSGTRCSMPFTIKVGKACGMNLDEINEIISNIFNEVERTLNNWNPNSEVSIVNSLPAGECHEMSEMLREVILCSKDLVKSTNGAFDPSVGPILKHYESNAWNTMSDSTHESVHSSECNEESKQRAVINVWKDLLSLGYSSDPKDLRVSKKVKGILEFSHWYSAFSVKERKFISKKHDNALLDLSGIAKGYTIDEIVKSLPSPCYVEWGGDLKVKGCHPSGRPWQVAVVQPPSLKELTNRLDKAKCDGQCGPVYTLTPYESKEEGVSSKKYIAVFDLSDGDAITTSGDSEKVVEREGKIYSHIINPSNGRMLEINDSTLALAVVVSKSCMVADALSTAAICMEDPSLARAMLEPLRTRFREPLRDFLLYSRYGPRVIRLSIPGVEPKEFRKQRLEKHKPCKVIVVGSGLAGLSAAIEAADARAHVIVLEKESMTGGNSSKATSGINGWGTYTQAAQNIPDDERLFERDTHRSGMGGTTNPSLVRALSTQSAQAIHWLQQKFDIPLSILSQLGGHSTKRTHRAPPGKLGRPVPVGFLIMQTMKRYIDIYYSSKIEIRCGAKVNELLHSIDREGVKTVIGVKVEVNGSNVDEDADSIILATGGFGCCQSLDGLISKYRPDLLGFPTTNGSFAQGDGVVLGKSIGAKLIDMDKIQLHPTGFIDRMNPSDPTKILAPEAIRGCGGILVSSTGERFVNELDLRSVVAKAILENCSPYRDESYDGPPFAWCILSKESQELFGASTLQFYKDRLGLFDSCADVKEMASLIGCEVETLYQTLQSYSDAKRRGTCLKTFKDIFPADVSPTSKDFVVARVTPSIHYTMGGLSISVSGEVLEPLSGHFGSHRHIRNLYAAGEVTGGVHGNNRLAGNSLLECVVFGRTAGERAATVLQPSNVMFPFAQSDDVHSRTVWEPVVLREVRNTDDKYQKNTIEIRFNLHGSTQHSGLDVGQFIGLRGDLDGETLLGYFSPITRPEDEGVIGILCRNDDKGGHITKLIRKLRPGSVMHMCPMGGLRLKFEEDEMWFRDSKISRVNLIAGGTGIAPMIQVIRAYSRHIRNNGGNISGGLNLIYAAEDESDLAFMKLLSRVHDDFPQHFKFYVKLNSPPLGWTEGVGFIDARDIRKHLAYPQRDGDLNIVCGPPIFENAMLKLLTKQGFLNHQIYSFSGDEKVACSSLP